MVIKRIAPLSAAKIAGLIYALIGFPFALLVWAASLVGLSDAGLRGSPFGPGSAFIAGAGAIAVVTLPIIYGVFGFVMTLIGAWLYNVMAGFVGGLRIEVQTEV